MLITVEQLALQFWITGWMENIHICPLPCQWAFVNHDIDCLLNKRHEVFDKEQSAILFIQIFLQLRDLCRKEPKKVFRKEPKEVLQIEPKKVLLSPLCIKLGHLKNFVNAFNKNCDVFQHLKQFWQNEATPNLKKAFSWAHTRKHMKGTGFEKGSVQH